MAEYIEREKAIELIERYGGDIAVREIKRLPAADVRPERHGQWERTGSMSLFDKHLVFYHCTACDRGLNCEDGDYIEFEFCPFCGAKMDGEDGGSNV